MKLPNLMVVDDDPEVCEIVALTLQDSYGVVAETDGRRAAERLAELEPEVVVVDLVMPGMDGLTLCEEIKSKRPETVVVIITAATKDSDLPDAFWQMGTRADAFITKPFDPVLLRAKIHELRVERVERMRGAQKRQYGPLPPIAPDEPDEPPQQT